MSWTHRKRVLVHLSVQVKPSPRAHWVARRYSDKASRFPPSRVGGRAHLLDPRCEETPTALPVLPSPAGARVLSRGEGVPEAHEHPGVPRRPARHSHHRRRRAHQRPGAGGQEARGRARRGACEPPARDVYSPRSRKNGDATSPALRECHKTRKQSFSKVSSIASNDNERRGVGA